MNPTRADTGDRSADASPRIRIVVPTFRRAEMLRRALASLQAQTFTDWVASVHNDDPDDPAPAAIVQPLRDPRLTVSASTRHLGAVATFNLAYTEGTEPFLALLEDDTTWNPDFLQRMLRVLEAHPQVAAAWCNQRVFEQASSGDWIDTGGSVEPEPRSEDEPPRWMNWGGFERATGAALSNGAMLVRRARCPALVTPAIPFAGVEAVRERLLPHPLLYVPQCLATYARTRQTARSLDGHAWGALQTLLLATYFRHARLDRSGRRSFWSHLSRQSPPPTNIALHAAFTCPGCRSLLSCAGPRDWLRYLRTLLGRPTGAWICLRARRRHPDWWTLLDSATADRFAEFGQPAGLFPR